MTVKKIWFSWMRFSIPIAIREKDVTHVVLAFVSNFINGKWQMANNK